MIQLYSLTNNNYEKNGDMTLFPTEATVHPILNGSWEAELTHPIDGEGRWKYIVEEAVVKMPSFNGDQLFRIKAREKSDSGITATMEPIFMDAMDDCFLVDVRPTVKNGQQALDIMTTPNSKYSGQSDITKTATAYYQFKNLIEAINGDDENSFTNRWGGEILFDNFTIIINERIGGDYGVELRYGKNIPQDGMSEEVDTRDVVTRIYPKAYNGYTMTNNGYVDSLFISNYPTVRCAVFTFDDVKMRADAQEDDEENGVIICDTQEELDAALANRCKTQYDAGIDKPKITISADMVLLQNTEQYKEYRILEEVSLGDTIHCRNNHLGITTDARVIELTYDSLRKKVQSVVIGDFAYNYFDNMTSSVNRIDNAIRPDGTVKADQISGIINGMATRLRAMKDTAQKQNVRSILFEDLDINSPTYGAMAIGTAGFEISDTRTPDDKDWVWSTFGTANGFYATYLIAGILSSRNWVKNTMGFQMNLDEGTINSKNMRMGTDGIMRLYQAIIEGGNFTVNYNDNGNQRIMFVVNQNGVGIGPGGEVIQYYAGDSFVSVNGELRLMSGKMTGYADNGAKGIELNRTQMNFYAWNEAGNYVGSIGSVRRSSDERVGVTMWCDNGDILLLGYDNGGTEESGSVSPFLVFDSRTPDEPPWIKGGVSGSFNVTVDVGYHTSGGYVQSIEKTRMKVTVKNGIITGWEGI